MNEIRSKTSRIRPILVVEDDQTLRESLEDLLKFSAYDCVAVSNSSAALNFLDASPALPRLIISDILMPGMDGFQLMTTVRNNPRLKLIPFLFLSGQETKLMPDSVKSDVAYLLKPCQVHELFDAIERLLSSN